MRNHSAAVTIEPLTRWAARLLSLASMAVILVFVIGELSVGQPPGLTLPEWIGLLFFPFGVLLGMIVAWRWEGLGAAITIGSLLLFYVYQFVLGGQFPRGPYFVLLGLPGFLFGVSWLLWKRKAA